MPTLTSNWVENGSSLVGSSGCPTTSEGYCAVEVCRGSPQRNLSLCPAMG
jgi:hypothetical protein